MKWVKSETCKTMDLDSLKIFCGSLLKKLAGNEVFLLDGPMASGKSEFVKQIVTLYLGQEVSSSPSYALHHEYLSGKNKVEHWDLFRLESEEDLESTGFWDRLQNSQCLTFIEWAAHLNQDWLPRTKKYYYLKFSKNSSEFQIEFNQAT